MRTKNRYPFLQKDTNRYGTRWYFRRDRGPKIRIRGEFGSPEFIARYQAVLRGEMPGPVPPTPPKIVHGEGTLAWVFDRYRASTAWTSRTPKNRRQHESLLLPIMEKYGANKFCLLKKAQIEASMEKRKDTPTMQRIFLEALSGMCRWAKAEKLISDDPTAEIPKVKQKGNKQGHPTWTEAEIDAYQKHWPLGTRQRVWLDVLQFTGGRVSDAHRLCNKMLGRDGTLSFRTIKTNTLVEMPVLDELRASLEAGPTHPDAWITNYLGRPFGTADGFGESFSRAARAAGVGKTAHGVRKASACRAAENGATTNDLMAIYGWTSEKMPTIYTRSARNRVIAKGAITKLARVA